MNAALRLFARAFIAATLALCAAAAALTVTMHARDSLAQLRLELLGGRCQQDATGNHIWYVEGYPHSLDLSSTCYAASVSKILHRAGGYDLGARLGYVDLGAIHASGVYPMQDAEHDTVVDGSQCNPSIFAGCLGGGTGTQTARGVTLGAIAERRFGDFTLGGELGVFLYRGAWAIDVEPRNGAGFAPVHIAWSGRDFTHFFGVTVQWKYLMAMGRYYARVLAQEPNCNGCSGFADGPALQVLAGVSIPL